MRILLIHNFYQEESGENAVFRHEASILNRFGEQVLTYTRHNKEITGYGVRQRAVAFAEGFFSIHTWREMRTLVARERPDVALVQNVFPLISPSVYWALKAAKVPVVQLVYNYRFICPDAHLYSLGEICHRCVRGNIAHAIIRRCYRNSVVYSAWYAIILGMHRALGTFRRKVDLFLVPDNFMRDKLVEGGLPPERIQVNTNPYELDEPPPIYEWDNYVLFIGRLIPQKGVLTAVRAMANVQPGLHLIVVGDGPQQAALETAAKTLAPGRVQLIGPQWGEDLRQLLRRALAVIIPSEWYDNAPLVLYQAFAAGKPVIAANIDGLPEVVEDEVNGLLFSPGDAAALAGAINQLASDPSAVRAMSRAARRKAESEFDAPAHYLRLRAVLEKAIGKGDECFR